MSRDLIDQLQENGRVAVETASIVTKLLSASLLNQTHRERFRVAVMLRHGEIVDLKSRIAATSVDNDLSRFVSLLEALWNQIAEQVSEHQADLPSVDASRASASISSQRPSLTILSGATQEPPTQATLGKRR